MSSIRFISFINLFFKFNLISSITIDRSVYKIGTGHDEWSKIHSEYIDTILNYKFSKHLWVAAIPWILEMIEDKLLRISQAKFTVSFEKLLLLYLKRISFINNGQKSAGTMEWWATNLDVKSSITQSSWNIRLLE